MLTSRARRALTTLLFYSWSIAFAVADGYTVSDGLWHLHNDDRIQKQQKEPSTSHDNSHAATSAAVPGTFGGFERHSDLITARDAGLSMDMSYAPSRGMNGQATTEDTHCTPIASDEASAFSRHPIAHQPAMLMEGAPCPTWAECGTTIRSTPTCLPPPAPLPTDLPAPLDKHQLNQLRLAIQHLISVSQVQSLTHSTCSLYHTPTPLPWVKYDVSRRPATCRAYPPASSHPLSADRSTDLLPRSLDVHTNAPGKQLYVS